MLMLLVEASGRQGDWTTPNILALGGVRVAPESKARDRWYKSFILY